ncbi:MFS general substrate transporter [Auriscalpium vulgare]|uniref:MFS general substrate transporter n=1 Tax=Auriscalpium vulgare TaxID=40419 RepID=A0ACB8RUT1_9AGAM|nr:MFS general substrate transporter [Auriscalpium vulgare]
MDCSTHSSKESPDSDVVLSKAMPNPGRPPWGLKWRSSVWFITLVVGLGITTDLIVYSVVIPVLPFQLQGLGYNGVSALVGYLLFAYSGGLVISTPPIAWVSERYNARRAPLLIGLIALVSSQVMLMEAPTYAVMVVARVLQGVSSSMVWVVGLALLCDTTPEKYVGRQLGIAMSGLSLGLLIGPPVGGALYGRFGWHGPCVFGILVTLVDLAGRLLVIERKEAVRWGFDPAAVVAAIDSESGPASSEGSMPVVAVGLDGAGVVDVGVAAQTELMPPAIRLSSMKVLGKLARSSRALTALVNSLIYGIIYSSQEPALPLHMQRVWGFNSQKVGLVYIAAVVPTLLSSPLAGWWADAKGAEWIAFICFALAVPWWGIVIIEAHLGLFITAFALENFFTAAVIAPLMAELAAVGRSLEGVGYAHIYGAFNLAFGVGSALGPLIGGQIFEHARKGWMVLNIVAVGLIVVALVLSFIYTGDRPLVTRLVARVQLPESDPSQDMPDKGPGAQNGLDGTREA